MAKKTEKKKCRCRPPRRHSDCMYCGSSWGGEFVCGVCHENGIDGQVIRGTSRVTCAECKRKAAKK